VTSDPTRSGAPPGERTALAGDRTLLANERTLAAWWRTAMTALAAAVGFAKLFGGTGPSGLARGGATLLVLLALLVLVIAFRNFRRTSAGVESEYAAKVPSLALWLGTLVLAATALIVAAVIWFSG